MDLEKLRELATEIALGRTNVAAEGEFWELIAQADAETRREIAELFDTAALLGLGKTSAPPATLKGKVLAGIKQNAPAAMDAGFADTAHLTRTFRASFGLTPSEAIAGGAQAGAS